MLCHITGLAGLLTAGFGNWIGPLVIWLLKKEEYPFVDDQGKEALNFQITCLIGFLIGVITTWLIIGFLIIAVVGVLWLIYTIIAAVQASITPMDDHRGSAWFRRTLAANLLRGFFAETSTTPFQALSSGHTGTILPPASAGEEVAP